jgi:hypothetical protein
MVLILRGAEAFYVTMVLILRGAEAFYVTMVLILKAQITKTLQRMDHNRKKVITNTVF